MLCGYVRSLCMKRPINVCMYGLIYVYKLGKTDVHKNILDRRTHTQTDRYLQNRYIKIISRLRHI